MENQLVTLQSLASKAHEWREELAGEVTKLLMTHKAGRGSKERGGGM